MAAPGPRGADPDPRSSAPAGDGAAPLVAYLHGGGWVLGSLDGVRPAVPRAGERLRRGRRGIDYRLAPGASVPGRARRRARCRALAGRARAPSSAPTRRRLASPATRRAATSPPSPRAGCATRATRRCASRRSSIPSATAALNTPSYRENGDGFGLTAPSMKRYWDLYLDGADGRQPDASPLGRTTSPGSRPRSCSPSSDDVLRDEGEAYARALEAAGVPVTLRRYDGAVHGFFRWLAKAELARRAVAEVGAALRAPGSPSGRMRDVAAPTPADLDAAAALVAARLAPTPLVPAPALGERCTAQARDVAAHRLVQGPRRAGGARPLRAGRARRHGVRRQRRAGRRLGGRSARACTRRWWSPRPLRRPRSPRCGRSPSRSIVMARATTRRRPARSRSRPTARSTSPPTTTRA